MFSLPGSQIFNLQLFQNKLGLYIIAIILFILFWFLLFLIRGFTIKYLKRISKHTKTDADDLLLKIVEEIKNPLYIFTALFLASQILKLPSFLSRSLIIVFLSLLTYQAIISLQFVIDYVISKWALKEDAKGTKYAYGSIAKISKILLWIFGSFLILSNLGINVTSLLAGLGIGGIAIALALQNILTDLFSSFAIYFDKPFIVGDFIIVGDKMGVVEKIGIKTTRIKALQGEEVVISNKELTSAQIQNFKRMQERRVVFSFGVLYETPQAKLKKIPSMVKDIITKIKDTRFDRAHFFKFDNSALYFEVVYYVLSGDYNVYMNTQQEINFEIKDTFEKENISMAYPTRTVYIAKS